MKKLLLIISVLLISSVALADNTSFNPNSVALAPRTTDTTPIGTVVIWSNNQAFPDINGNTVWLPCNGQEIPVGVEYDELRASLASNNLPNYNNDQFLKGATSNIGQEVAEQSKILSVDIPAHKHDLAGGVAGGQTFTYNAPSGGTTAKNWKCEKTYCYAAGPGVLCDPVTITFLSESEISGGRFDIGSVEIGYFVIRDHNYGGGTVCTRLDGGGGGSTTATGTTSASGLSGTTGLAGATTMTIKDTTAPAHTKVMYYIKARD